MAQSHQVALRDEEIEVTGQVDDLCQVMVSVCVIRHICDVVYEGDKVLISDRELVQ